MITPIIGFELSRFSEKLTIKKNFQQTLILDPLRRKYLVLTPEEMVRQLVIQGMLEKGYPMHRMACEKKFVMHGLNRRFDILVLTPTLHPWMLVECKAADYILSQQVFDQVLAYNYHFQVPYVLASNGRDTYCLAVNVEKTTFESLTEIPKYPSLFPS